MPLSDSDLEAAFRASSLFREFEQLSADETPLPDSEAKRHHFIPQFLLRRFLVEGRDRLFQLDVDTGTPQAIAPSQAASRRHFYSVIEEGSRHTKIESLLAIVEGHAAPALERWIATPTSLDPGDRATLAYFIGLVGVRTPRAADRVARESNELMTYVAASHATHPDIFARQYREVIGEAPDEEIEALRIDMLEALAEGRVGLDDPRAHAIGMGLQMSADLATVIFRASWSLLRTEASFVTSDAGLAMYDPTPRFPWSGNGWASSPNAMTTVPLGATHCLAVTPGDSATLDVIDVDAETTALINLRTYGWATDYIYGGSQDVVTEVRRLAKRRPADVIRPRPIHQTILVEASADDTALAEEHVRRGWPPYLLSDGKRHDYIVIGVDGTPVESGERASQLARERAQ